MSLKAQGHTSGKTGNIDYESYTTTNSYCQRTFGFPAEVVSLVNDSDTDQVQLSWDGVTQVYNLAESEYKDIPAHGRSSIYVKATTGGETVRITAT